MNAGNIIKTIMKKNNISQSYMVEKLGINEQSVISKRLNQKNISINLLNDMLDVLGYELIIQSKNDKESRYVVQSSQK